MKPSPGCGIPEPARPVWFVVATCLLSLLPACSPKQPPGATVRQVPAQTERHVVEEWTRDGLPTSREGRPQDGYVFLQLTTGESGIWHRYYVLKEGYGTMIFWEACPPERKYPIPRFRLFSHDRGVLIETTDIAEFKQALSQIPPGETLRLMDTCCGSTHSGIDPDILKQVESFCRAQGIIYIDNETGVICTCA